MRVTRFLSGLVIGGLSLVHSTGCTTESCDDLVVDRHVANPDDGLLYDGIGTMAGAPEARRVTVRLDADDASVLVYVYSYLVGNASYESSATAEYNIALPASLPLTFPVVLRTRDDPDAGKPFLDATFDVTIEGTSIGSLCVNGRCAASAPNSRLVMVRRDAPAERVEIAMDVQTHSRKTSCSNGALVR